MNKITKILLILFIAFFYLFPNRLLTHVFYPYGNKGLFGTNFYLIFNGHLIDIIDLNIPHFIAFIIIGFAFKLWALLFSILSEILQTIIRHNQFSFIDTALNLFGSLIGIALFYAKKSKAVR